MSVIEDDNIGMEKHECGAETCTALQVIRQIANNVALYFNSPARFGGNRSCGLWSGLLAGLLSGLISGLLPNSWRCRCLGAARRAALNASLLVVFRIEDNNRIGLGTGIPFGVETRDRWRIEC